MNTEFKIQRHLNNPEDLFFVKRFTGDREPAIYKKVSGPLRCKDGFTVSVQASNSHYCVPRTVLGPYTHVEMGFPSEDMGPAFVPYAEDHDRPTDTVYANVPINLVVAIVDIHGGLIDE